MDPNNFEDLGIYQDKSVADSVPVEDFSLNISSDDEARIDDQNSDGTFDIGDVSIAEQSNPDVGSLTEFEEIERKIRKNRVEDDTDDNTDISDIPTDMENRSNKNKGSRATSANSSRQPSFEQKIKSPTDNTTTTPTISRQISMRRSSSATSSSPVSPPSPTMKRRKQLQDTGYMSQSGVGTSPNSPPYRQQPGTSRRQIRDQILSSPSSNDEHQTHGGSSIDLTTISPMQSTHDNNITPMNNSGEPNSMVATFGTTEDFERLLKQQLVDDETNDMYEPFQLRSESSSENEKEKSKTSASASSSPEPKPINKPMAKERTSKLPVKTNRSSTLPQPRSKPSTSTTKPTIKLKTNPAVRRNSSKSGKRGNNNTNHVRSPAANRARNARNMRTANYSSLTRESSGDDLSVRSDVSSTELKTKLRTERKSGKEQANLLKHLQENYSDLLMKFADAENTIDKLRLGAKIDLAVSIPQANEDLSLPGHYADMKIRRSDSNISA